MQKIKCCITILFLLSIIIFPCENVFAKQQVAFDYSDLNNQTIELIKMFPQFEESLKNNTTGELVGSKELYVKYTLKPNMRSKKLYDNMDEVLNDYNIKEYTKDEYLKEIKSNNRYIGNPEEVYCSWLRLTLQVYVGSGNSDYLAYNFSSWLTHPICCFTDGIGISTSNGLIMSRDSSTRKANYNFGGSNFGDHFENLGVSIGSNGNGVLAKLDLKDSNLIDYHNCMVSTGISYNSSSIDSGWITGHYLHKQVGVGGLGISANGTPSISASCSNDSHKKSIYVSR